MALRLQELCKTTRRAAGSGLPRLFPRVLGDDRLDARLGIAIRFFETHLGRSRATGPWRKSSGRSARRRSPPVARARRATCAP
jgi:hypothetical protein